MHGQLQQRVVLRKHVGTGTYLHLHAVHTYAMPTRTLVRIVVSAASLLCLNASGQQCHHEYSFAASANESAQPRLRDTANIASQPWAEHPHSTAYIAFVLMLDLFVGLRFAVPGFACLWIGQRSALAARCMWVNLLSLSLSRNRIVRIVSYYVCSATGVTLDKN